MKSQFKKYPVLSVVSILLQIIGLIVVVLSVLFLITVFINPDKIHMILLKSVSGFLAGLIMLAMGDAIGVLFVIEANTRKAVDIMQTVLSTLPVPREPEKTDPVIK